MAKGRALALLPRSGWQLPRIGLASRLEHEGSASMKPLRNDEFISAGKPKPRQASAREPTTIGGHLRRRRLQLRILQPEAARMLQVSTVSLSRWECDKIYPTRPITRILCAIWAIIRSIWRGNNGQNCKGNETKFVAFFSQGSATNYKTSKAMKPSLALLHLVVGENSPARGVSALHTICPKASPAPIR